MVLNSEQNYYKLTDAIFIGYNNDISEELNEKVYNIFHYIYPQKLSLSTENIKWYRTAQLMKPERDIYSKKV